MFLNEIQSSEIQRRRELIFLILSGLFLGSLAMLNILGVSRFIDLSHWIGISDTSSVRFSLAVGVLPYPITFLCTDLISEIYGRKRANRVVWVGFFLNLWILLILWLGGELNPPDGLVNGELLPQIQDGEAVVPYGYSFYEIRKMTFGATFASMIAYLSAQFVDVQLFHFLKKKTQGKMLWLRNNVSTLVSQLVDSIAVILITYFYANALPLNDLSSVESQLFYFILSGYLFKVFCALFDTLPMYWLTKKIRSYLQVEGEIR